MKEDLKREDNRLQDTPKCFYQRCFMKELKIPKTVSKFFVPSNPALPYIILHLHRVHEGQKEYLPVNAAFSISLLSKNSIMFVKKKINKSYF